MIFLVKFIPVWYVIFKLTLFAYSLPQILLILTIHATCDKFKIILSFEIMYLITRRWQERSKQSLLRRQMKFVVVGGSTCINFKMITMVNRIVEIRM